MNKQIEELRLEAGIARLHELPYMVALNKEGAVIEPLDGLEKFALLIAQDIASLIESQDVDPAFKHRISWAVKDRYGVE